MSANGGGADGSKRALNARQGKGIDRTQDVARERTHSSSDVIAIVGNFVAIDLRVDEENSSSLVEQTTTTLLLLAINGSAVLNPSVDQGKLGRWSNVDVCSSVNRCELQD